MRVKIEAMVQTPHRRRRGLLHLAVQRMLPHEGIVFLLLETARLLGLVLRGHIPRRRHSSRTGFRALEGDDNAFSLNLWHDSLLKNSLRRAKLRFLPRQIQEKLSLRYWESRSKGIRPLERMAF